MVSAVFSVASLTCNPEVFKEHFTSFNIMIALVGGLSTESLQQFKKAKTALDNCFFRDYRSATQDMVSLSWFVLL
jgi:hypothetical protein